MTQTTNPNLVHAFSNDVLANMDATDVAQAINRGDFSAQEACEASLKRLEQAQSLDAVVHEQFDLALSQANSLNQGFFAGVPFFIKDNLAFKGLPTTHGSQAIPTRSKKSSDPLVEQMLAMGFNVLGKSKLPEIGLTCATEYPDGSYVANPWNTKHIAGGSSGGAAALVASGVVPIAHGNDGAGSLRIPASMCGLFSLKCTRGRHVLTNLSRPLPLNIISDGVLTRSVRDCANFFMELEKQYKPKKMPLLGDISTPSKKRLRIGVLKESPNSYPLDSETQRVLDETIKLLEGLGHNVVEAKPFSKPEHASNFILYFSFLAFSASKIGKSLYGKEFDKNKLDKYTQGLSKHFAKNFYKAPWKVVQSIAIRQAFYKQMSQYDVVLSPVLTELTPQAGYLSPNVEAMEVLQRLTDLASFNAIHNVMGTPSMSVPLGLSSPSASIPGLPIGMQFAANLGDDKKLLELAFELEQAAGFTQIYDQA